MVDSGGTVHWQFPTTHGLPAGQRFSADDAFLSPDGKTITANEEGHEVIVRIDIATRRIVWEDGRYDHAGSGPGRLHTPDDAYPLRTVTSSSPTSGTAGSSRSPRPRRSSGNGVERAPAPSTPREPMAAPTAIASHGWRPARHRDPRVASRAPRSIRSCRLRHPRADPYPSDAQLLPNGDVLVVDYANPGAILKVNRHGKVLWRYGPRTGVGRLDHPSLPSSCRMG